MEILKGDHIMKNDYYYMFYFLIIPLYTVPSPFGKTGPGKTHFIVGHPTPVLEKHTENKPTVPVKSNPISRSPKKFQILFAPQQDIRQQLVHLINNEQDAIHIAIFILTDISITAALCNAKKRGVTVEIITDVGCLKDKASKVNQLYQNGCMIYIYNPLLSSKASSLMHHKFALFKNNDKRPCIWTGSYNFTKAATIANQENVIIFSDQHAFTTFLEEFNRLKNKSYTYSTKTIS